MEQLVLCLLSREDVESIALATILWINDVSIPSKLRVGESDEYFVLRALPYVKEGCNKPFTNICSMEIWHYSQNIMLLSDISNIKGMGGREILYIRNGKSGSEYFGVYE